MGSPSESTMVASKLPCQPCCCEAFWGQRARNIGENLSDKDAMGSGPCVSTGPRKKPEQPTGSCSVAFEQRTVADLLSVDIFVLFCPSSSSRKKKSKATALSAPPRLGATSLMPLAGGTLWGRGAPDGQMAGDNNAMEGERGRDRACHACK